MKNAQSDTTDIMLMNCYWWPKTTKLLMDNRNKKLLKMAMHSFKELDEVWTKDDRLKTRIANLQKTIKMLYTDNVKSLLSGGEQTKIEIALLPQ